MHLIFENIRCYRGRHEWHFDNNGITLISGKSGAGKTSILIGINFIITNLKKNIISDGCNSARGELIYNNIKISRSKRPDHLKVYPNWNNDQNIYIEDDQAQSFINNIFGPFFESISYIPQQYEKSFLYMDSSDKLKLLEKLSFPIHSNFKPEDMKKKCSDKLKELNEQIISLNGIKYELENNLNDNITCPNTVDKPIHDETYCIVKLEELKYIETNHKKFLEELELKNILQKQIEQCNLDLSELSSTDKFNINTIFEQINFRKELDNNCTVSTEHPWEKYTREEATEIMHDYERDIKLFEEYTDISNKINNMKPLKDELNKQIKEKKIIENYCEGIFNCPKCTSKLVLKNNILELSYDNVNTIEDISKKQYLLKICMQKIDTLSEKTNSFHFLEDKKKSIESLIDVEGEDLNQLRRDLNWIKQYITDNCILEQNIQKNNERKNYLSSVIDHSLNMDELNNKLEQINKKSYILNNKQKLEQRVSTLCTKTIKVSYDEIQKQKEYFNIQLRINTQYRLYQSEYNNWKLQLQYKERLKKITWDLNKLKCKSNALINLKQLILKTESEIIEKNMKEISALVNLYCSRMFEEPINIELLTTKKTQTQHDKVYIQLNIDYKGMSNSDISYLSGGEQARLNLAFILAFAYVFHSPLLLLDECTSNLDQEMTDIVMEQIADVQIPKIIVIAHQIVEGKFQQIIHC